MSRHRRPILLLVLPAALVVAFLAACGGGGGSDDEAQTLLHQTFTGQKEVRSGRLDLRMALDAPGLGGVTGPVAVHLRGPFDNGRPGSTPKFDFALDTRTGRSRLQAGAVSDGKKGYLRLSGRAYELPDAVFRQFSSKGGGAGKAAGRAGPTLSGLGLDPTRWLRDVHTEERTSSGGDPTVHLTGKVDVKRFVQDLDKLLGATGGAGLTEALAPQALSGAQRKTFAKAIESANVDIWTGTRDKTLRRLAVVLHLKGPQGKGKGGTMRLDLSVADLNRRQAIGPPADPRPLSELTAALASFARAQGQAQSSGGSPSGGSGSSSASSGAASGTSYDRCLAEAGSDIAAAQRCAALVGR
ncbi:MAG TPA: hypothetical protein VGP78_03080 [Solirubrobacteraceae bacterium]|nr:hypothetical protein [Solirubrobacteraceae bacterium]